MKECKVGEEHCSVQEKDLRKTEGDQQTLVVSQEVSQENNEVKLSFNCPGDDPFETKNKFLNQWPLSESCKFAVGLFAMANQGDFVTYSLSVKGKNIMKNL